jgi:cell division protein ZapA (FtsZ GTPase activity inhibitor)
MLVEIAVGKSKYLIETDESEKENLLNFATKLNEEINKLSLLMPKADEKTLLLISNLTCQARLEENRKSSENKPSFNQTKSYREEDENNQSSEAEIYEAVSSNMENIASYIETLIKKIREY